MRDRYELQGRLGAGAHGAVYRGRDTLSGRTVAVKIMGAGAPGVDERATRATPCAGHAAWAALSHPNIVAIYDSGSAGAAAFIVMESAPGIDLRRHVLPERRLPLATTLSVIARTADALAHAHACGVVHGDVNPANIVFDAERDSVKLTDFHASAAAGAAGAGARGTFAYMSPEQVCGLPAGAASDQFSLGATLYRLACGRLPFVADALPRLAWSIVNEPHADIRVHDAALPAGLARTLDRMLAKNPAARYMAVGDAACAIRQVAAALARVQSA